METSLSQNTCPGRIQKLRHQSLHRTSSFHTSGPSLSSSQQGEQQTTQQYSHVQERALTNNTSLHPTDRPKAAERLLERPLFQPHHNTVLVLLYHVLCDHCCLHFHCLLTSPTCGWYPVVRHDTEKVGWQPDLCCLMKGCFAALGPVHSPVLVVLPLYAWRHAWVQLAISFYNV